MSGSGVLPPLEGITAENQGPAVVVAAYTLLVVMGLFAAIRIGSIFKLKRPFGVDDAFLVTAVIIALAESVTIGKAADAGLGRHQGVLSSDQLDKYYKFSYTSDLLAVLAMACAKISVLHLMLRLSTRGMQRIYPVMAGAICIWTIFSVFAIAFQCGTTQPWVYTPAKCAGQGAVWYPIIIFNILTDLALAFIFAPIAWKLQMAMAQRLTVTTLFAVRLVVVGAAIAQLAFLAPSLRARDQTRAHTTPAILEQVVMNCSIFAATAPSLHRFLSELQTSRLGTQIPTTQYELSQGSSKANTWKPFSKSYGKGSKTRASEKSAQLSSFNNSDGKSKLVDFRPDLLDKSQSHIQHDPVNQAETGSRTSDGSQDMIIRQTVAWEVQHFDNQELPEPDSNGRSRSQHHAM